MRSVLILIAALGSLSAMAIIMRHDVDEEAYVADRGNFPGIVHIDPEMGHGVLIAPNWVLTAAHAVMCMYPGETIYAFGEDHEVEHIIWHPDVRGEPPELNRSDLALVKLRSNTAGTPAPLYQQRDEKGKVAWFVGTGGKGKGDVGESDQPDLDGVLRKAENQIYDVHEHWLEFVFDAPPHALPLEGISGMGDSGGPAYINMDEEWYLAGISAWQDWKEGPAGIYGVHEYYARVSSYTNWIDSVISMDDEALAAISRNWQRPPEVRVSPDTLSRYEGAYELEPGFVLNVTAENGRLYIEGASRNQVYPASEDEFYYFNHPIKVVFVADDRGSISHLVWHNCGERDASKIK